jgi:NADH:ubiquinone oxidoreductase subunit B-like Fe-S oxidoreductase
MGIEVYLEKTPLMPYLDKVVNWGRKYSIWPLTFGLVSQKGGDVDENRYLMGK